MFLSHIDGVFLNLAYFYIIKPAVKLTHLHNRFIRQKGVGHGLKFHGKKLIAQGARKYGIKTSINLQELQLWMNLGLKNRPLQYLGKKL